MEKDKTILELIKRLKIHLDADHLEIIDHWDSDLCAIGLGKDSRLIYISTYNYLNMIPIRYDYDLELINESDETKINVLKSCTGVLEEELLAEITSFFLLK
jgi:hypothetical protein